jgi:hypothetical protein
MDDLIGKKLAGGDANPAALARPSSGSRGTSGRRTGRTTSGSGTKIRGVAKRQTSAGPRGAVSADHMPAGWEDPAAQGD